MAVYKRKGSDIYYMDFTRYGRRIFRSKGNPCSSAWAEPSMPRNIRHS